MATISGDRTVFESNTKINIRTGAMDSSDVESLKLEIANFVSKFIRKSIEAAVDQLSQKPAVGQVIDQNKMPKTTEEQSIAIREELSDDSEVPSLVPESGDSSNEESLDEKDPTDVNLADTVSENTNVENTNVENQDDVATGVENTTEETPERENQNDETSAEPANENVDENVDEKWGDCISNSEECLPDNVENDYSVSDFDLKPLMPSTDETLRLQIETNEILAQETIRSARKEIFELEGKIFKLRNTILEQEVALIEITQLKRDLYL